MKMLICRAAFCVLTICPFLSAQNVLIIRHVNVVNVADGTIQRDRTLTIKDGLISEVLSGQVAVPHGASSLDGSGTFVIPGLWDMHYHFEGGAPNVRELNLLLANGVLGIRDVGDKPEKIFATRSDISSGKILGPQIVACGPIVDGPDPTNPPLSVSVRSAEDARTMAHTLKDMGSDCIKVHDGVPLEAYLALAAEAKIVGLPLVGHVPVRVHVMQATNAGQRSIEHQIGLRGGSTAEDEVMESERKNDIFAEAMRTKNYQLIPESIAARGNQILDHFDQNRMLEVYRAFVKNGTYLDPTLVTDRGLTFVDDLSKRDDPRFKYIPSSQREWWNPERGMLTRYRTPAYIAFRKRQFEKTLQQIPIAHRVGVQFLAGTDNTLPFVYPGFSVHDEMALFVQAGLSPLEALQTATLNPATFLGLNRLGTVMPGKQANVVILEGNPLRDIRNTQKIRAVIFRGKLLDRKDLDGMLREAQVAAGEQ